MYKKLIEIANQYYGVIYKITNIINNKIYIGQTINLKNRIKDYKNKKPNKAKNKYHMIYVINKFKFENFEFTIIDSADSKEELLKKEIYYISKFDSTNEKIGYNRKAGGKGGCMNKKSKKKMSISSTGHKHTEATKIKKSKSILVYKNNKVYKYYGAKVFAETINRASSNVTRAIRKGIYVNRFLCFYEDIDERNQIAKTIDMKRKVQYFKILNLINEGVESIETYRT